MKLMWIFLLCLLQLEFGVSYNCEFEDHSAHICNINSKSNIKEKYIDGMTDDDVEEIRFTGDFRDHLTKQGFAILCERFEYLNWIKIDKIKSINEDLFQKCMNLKYVYIGSSKVEELPSNLFSYAKKLIWIKISENTLVNALPEKIFSKQINLKYLDVSKNMIYCLPPKVFNSLTKLKELYLNRNKIQSLNPKWFENLHSLEKLSLSENEIQDLPKDIFKHLKKMFWLSLWSNQLKTIHYDSFATLENLRYLSVQDNKINSIDEKIFGLESLNEVDMNGNACSGELEIKRDDMKEKLQKCFDNYKPRVNPKMTKCGTLLGRVPLIQKGNLTAPNEYPWNAALTIRNGHLICGGTIISNKHVVTAAHCIKGKKNEYNFGRFEFSVLLGAHDLSKYKEETRIKVPVCSIFIHPDWNVDVDHYEADIAVLELSRELNFDKNVRPICIPDVDSDVASATRGTAVGFGITENGRTSDIAKKLEIPIYTYKNCTEHSPDHIYIASPRSFCGGWADGSGVCSGDSGGGVYVIHRNAYYLRGIVSSSLPTPTGECDVERESVFTDVPKFYGWIKSGGLDAHALNREESDNKG